MPTEIVAFKCNVCGYTKHPSWQAAEACEQQGEPTFEFEVGAAWHNPDWILSRVEIVGLQIRAKDHAAIYELLLGQKKTRRKKLTEQKLRELVTQRGWRKL